MPKEVSTSKFQVFSFAKLFKGMNRINIIRFCQRNMIYANEFVRQKSKIAHSSHVLVNETLSSWKSNKNLF